MPFQPGQSGNPAGRPCGSRNGRTIIVEKLLDDSAGALTTAAITRATEGDPAPLRACMDRVAPPLRHRPRSFRGAGGQLASPESIPGCGAMDSGLPRCARAPE